MQQTEAESIRIKQLQVDIDTAMLSDRFRFRNKLRRIRSDQKTKKSIERTLSKLAGDVDRSVRRCQLRLDRLPSVSFPDDLPITARCAEIADAIDRHQVVVVCGETGSGKSTQLPKICLQLGRGVAGVIGHTQPRRIAARAVASRVAEELGSALGTHVGFKIRFSDVTSEETFVKVMTDGILLAETQSDRFLDKYDTIIIDEAHERSLNVDFLLGYLKRLLPKRPELRLVITSATLDVDRFAKHFGTSKGPAPVIEVSGRTYPVEVRYRPVEIDEEAREPDWQRAVADAVTELAAVDDGDMLIFMPTERDIRDTARVLRGRRLSSDTTEILPLYGRLSTAEQNKVFQAHKHRRIVIATNVAESSLTVPGIRYVIDPGNARISRYSARSKVQRLPIEPISQASADQRKGRCGRIAPGICIRLYSESDFASRQRFTAPEIQRTNLAGVILQTIALKLGPIESFPFLDPPRPTTVREGYATLFELGALDEQKRLTNLGRQLSRLPVDPRIGRMVLAGAEENTLSEMLIIASALELRDPRERPIDKQEAADKAHEQFADEQSDFLSILKLWNFYQELKARLSRNQLCRACLQNFLSYNRMREWTDIHRQLKQMVRETGIKSVSSAQLNDPDAIHRALLPGLLSNIALAGDRFEYIGASGTKFHLWPGSVAFGKKPKWIVAAELVETTRRYARTIARINPDWIEPLAGHLVKRSFSEPHWHAKSGAVMAFEKVSLFGLPIVPRRRAAYGRIDPVESRELFIQHGLVDCECRTSGQFMQRNQRLIDDISKLKAKTRQAELHVEDDAVYRFYDARIPADVFDTARFEKWRKQAEKSDARVLLLSQSDLIDEQAGSVDALDFPDTLNMNSMQLPVTYCLEPGTESDGLTLTVPHEGFHQLDTARIGWLVPGLLEQRIVAMIKSLPKSQRRMLVPAPYTARRVAKSVKFGEGNFDATIAAALHRICGERIVAQDFDQDKMPQHLKLNIRVVDSAGEELASGREMAELRRQLGASAKKNIAAVEDSRWNRDGLVEWDFDELPVRIEITRNGVVVQAFPALQDRTDSVSLGLMNTQQDAANSNRAGMLRLFILKSNRRLRDAVQSLPAWNRMTLNAATLPDAGRLSQHLAERVAERSLFPNSPESISRTKAEFQDRIKQAISNIGIAVQDVGELMAPLLADYQQIQLRLEESIAESSRYVLNDLRSQLDHLTGAGFLVQTPWPWLEQHPRYFQAMELRLEKLSSALDRDRKNTELITRRWQDYLQRLSQHEQQDINDPQLEHYRWMLEEFRVSIFAQTLGTAITISEKRLDRQWKKVQA